MAVGPCWDVVTRTVSVRLIVLAGAIETTVTVKAVLAVTVSAGGRTVSGNVVVTTCPWAVVTRTLRSVDVTVRGSPESKGERLAIS